MFFRLAGRLSIHLSFSCAKTLMLDIMCKLLNNMSFIPAMLIGGIDFDHFILLSVTLTMTRGRKVSGKQNLWPHFLTHFSAE